MNFGLIGAAGYIAPRHMKAIKETGNQLIAALDLNDSVGIMDSFFPNANFFTEPERFDRHIDKLRRKGKTPIDYIAVCSPNYLHDAHIRMTLRNNSHAICEKPLVLNPWNADALEELEHESGKNIYNILQLRLHPSIVALKKKIEKSPKNSIYDVDLSYITSRGKWYQISWKGTQEKSGGIATNIGVHFYDMLSWIFGDVKENIVHKYENDKAAGFLELKRARVRWFLSIDANDLPKEIAATGQRTFRSITVNNEEVEFSSGFTDLHTLSYQDILNGRGFRIKDARNAIQIVHDIRNNELVNYGEKHPFLTKNI